MSCSEDRRGKQSWASSRTVTRKLTRIGDPDQPLLDPPDPSVAGDPDQPLLDPPDPSVAGDPDQPLLDPPDPSARLTATRSERFERREEVCLPPREECYSGFIIVRLIDKIARRDEGCRELRKRERWKRKKARDERGEFPSLWEKFPDLCDKKPGAGDGSGCEIPLLECLETLLCECPPERLVQVLEPGEIRRLEVLAATTDLPPLHSLAAYWRIDGRHLPESTLRGLVRLLNGFVEVDLAYLERAAVDSGDGAPPDFEREQQYLDRAPLGIGARWARAQAAGIGVSLVDLEQGWFDHDDLPALGLIYGDNRDDTVEYRGDHGTSVLGELAALANGFGVTGAAPGLTVLQVSHYHRQRAGASPSNGHVADGVVAAIVKLCFALDPGADDLALGPEAVKGWEPPGDLLLIEVQRSFWPAEVDHADFDALRLASALGLIVVAAAGNGGSDLDRYRDETGRRILAPAAAGFRESGAVIVGAAESALPHERSRFSNYGARVDCYGLGDHVVTLGKGDLHDGGTKATTYTDSFSGTSSAAPMVAGAAALLQSLHQAKAGTSMAPAEMREILSGRATGTPQGPQVPGNVGVMPDVRAIARGLGLVPVFGTPLLGSDPVPSAELFGDSTPVLNPPSANAVEGKDLLRLRNHGVGRPAAVHVYRSELSVVTTPDMWESLEPISLPAEGSSDPIDLEIDPPAAGYKYLAIPQLPGEPEPVLPPGPPYFAWEPYRAFLRRHPDAMTIARPVPAEGKVELSFRIHGAADGPRAFDFEILRRPADGATVFLEVDDALVARIRRRLWKPARGPRFLLPQRPRISLPPLRLPAACPWDRRQEDEDRGCIGRFRAKLVVHRAGSGLTLTVRQLFEGEELGRVSWRFGD